MCSITPRRIAVIGSSTSPTWSGAAAGAGAAGVGRGGGAAAGGRSSGREAAAAGLRARRDGRGGRRSGPSGGGALGARLDVGEDVLLRHPAAGAGARDRARVDAVLGRDPGDDRRDERAAVPRRGARPRLGRAWQPARAPRPRDGLRRAATGSGAAGAGCGRRGSAARRQPAGRDHGQHRPDLDRLALGDEDLGDDALAGARNLGVDLVGRDLEQRLVLGDRLARLLEPLRDRSLRDRDTHLGHHHLDLRSRSQE